MALFLSTNQRVTEGIISLRDDFQSEPRDDKKEEGEEFIEAEQEKSEVDQYARRGSEGVASM
ncbi:hypothetical protein H206_03260 [Candidatus Electrothrix aarhusensis]|jgi:hypothetical protein|uniref:Uncharacterized protein n=1 Tax=Candidatus Electrothrix aarhusensis TaxID=1859131 RepID=A0A444IQ78_9BACT|nr:hypothetical protein H206_03260 [Candidatus Electrothrix aarhusensis]